MKTEGSILTEVEVLENRLGLYRLKFERAEARCDYHEMNIACAQFDYIARELLRHRVKVPSDIKGSV